MQLLELAKLLTAAEPAGLAMPVHVFACNRVRDVGAVKSDAEKSDRSVLSR